MPRTIPAMKKNKEITAPVLYTGCWISIYLLQEMTMKPSDGHGLVYVNDLQYH